MAAPTVAEFRAQFPTAFPVATHPDTLIEARISEARQIHAVRKLATLYLTAHLIAVDAENTGKPDGGSGVVTSEKIGPRTVNYATQAGGGREGTDKRRAFFATTSYGRRFLVLADTSPRAAIGARVV